MRRTILLVMLATMAVSTIAVAPAYAADNVTLTFWTFLDPKKNGPREKAWAEIIQSFEKKNPGITVRPEVFPWKEISPKLIVASTSRRGPDVTLVETDLSEKLARGKILEPLDQYIAATDPRLRDDFYHPETRIVDGKTYSINVWTNGSAVFYRKDLFEKAGLKPPRTLDDFVADAKALTVDTNGDGRIDQWGFAEGTARSQPFAHRTLFPLIWAQGGTIVSPDGKAVFNSPAGVKAVQWFVDLVKVQKVMPPDIVNLTYDERLQGFMAGKYAMIIEGLHRYQTTQTSPITKGKVGLSYIPSWDTNRPAPTPVTGWDIGIGANSKQKGAAWKFVAHALSYESQLVNAKIADQVPARRSVAKDPFFQTANATEMKFVLDYLAAGSREFPKAKNLDRLIDLFNQAINESIINGVPVKEALDRATAKYNEAL
jgi:multiple sugar transport system substrate-binding protein